MKTREISQFDTEDEAHMFLLDMGFTHTGRVNKTEIYHSKLGIYTALIYEKEVSHIFAHFGAGYNFPSTTTWAVRFFVGD